MPGTHDVLKLPNGRESVRGTKRDIMGKWKGILRRTRKERMDEREGERMGNEQDYTAGEQERKP